MKLKAIGIAITILLILTSCSGKRHFSALDEDSSGKRISSPQTDALAVPPDFKLPPPKN